MEVFEKFDTQDVLKYKFSNGMLFYPIVRYSLLEEIKFGSSENKSKRKPRIINLFFSLRYIFFRKKDLLYFTSTLFNSQRGSKYFNVLDDYYYQCAASKSFIFESPDKEFQIREPKENNNVSSFFFYLDFISATLSRFAIGFNKKTNSDVGDFITLLKEKGVIEEKINQVRLLLLRTEKTIALRECLYKRFFLYTKPQIIFVNCGCYGGSYAVIIKVAKSLGIKVAEIQHGLVSQRAVPYSYSSEIMNSEYEEYLPDYLFTFGEYWGEQMRNSCKKIVVGHPHLNSILQMNANYPTEKNSLLVVSQPTVNNELIDAVVTLMEKTNGLKVYYRTHPVEKLTDEQLTKLKNANIEITDPTSDLYLDFFKREFVFGCYSLSLVEACAFKKKPFILEHEYSKLNIPQDIGVWVKSGFDLAEKLKEKQIEVDSKKFWAPNFEQNFKTFLENIDL